MHRRARAPTVTHLISRCSVIRLRNLLYFFSSSRPDVFFRFCNVARSVSNPCTVQMERKKRRYVATISRGRALSSDAQQAQQHGLAAVALVQTFCVT